MLGACWLSTEMGALGVSIKRLSGVLPNINTHSRPEGRFPNGFPQPHSALVLKPRLKPFFFFLTRSTFFHIFHVHLLVRNENKKRLLHLYIDGKHSIAQFFSYQTVFFPPNLTLLDIISKKSRNSEIYEAVDMANVTYFFTFK